MYQLCPTLFFKFADLVSQKHGPSGIGARSESTSPLQHRAQPLSILNAVCSGVGDLALDRDRRADVAPSGELVNRQNVTRFEQRIGG